MSQHTAHLHPDPIAFIGGGNMARSLIGGLVTRGMKPARIRVVEPVEAVRASLAGEFGVQVFADAAEATYGAGLWMLAVKPQVMRAVCEPLATRVREQNPIVVSIAAGITSTQLERWLGGEAAIIRSMPNTPALLGAGVSGMFANARVDEEGRTRAEALLASVGKVVWLDDESQMDAVTAVSGSGPAYVFLLAEAMEAAAREQGLSSDAARQLVQQTLLGASRMLIESGQAPDELRHRVTSPNGTTQAAIETFQAGGFEALVARAIHAATVRGAELSAANE